MVLVRSGQFSAVCFGLVMMITPVISFVFSCGKILRDHDAVMFHAAKTNHENFSESAEVGH